MSGYHRIAKLKNCLNSFNSLKNIKKLNDKLGKEINSICKNERSIPDSTGYFHRIKEINKILAKEVNQVAADVRTKSNGVLNAINDNLMNYKEKLKDGIKPMYSIPDTIEERKSQYRHKHLKAKHIRKEAEKLCQYLSKHQAQRNTFVLGAAGLSLAEIPESLTAKTATVVDATKTDSAATVVDSIPEPPAIPDAALEALNQLNALGEPTFASLGLGGWTPVGMVQQCMEYLHVTLGIDWWAAIVIGTLVIRICMFPLVIMSQRNAAKMHNYMPQMQFLQMKMSEARQTGDAINAARYGHEMMAFMKEKGLSPFKNMLVPMAQAPVFISFFMGLRQMANVPVESLTHGGLFWFQDLTLPDQYFLLPIITSTTLWLTIELGTDGAKLSSQNMQIMKYVLRAIPVVIFPFTINFPGVILCYWVSSNFISLGQVAFLRIPKIRQYFKIEPMMKHKPEDLPTKPKGFREGLKDSWTNVKITKELEERRRLDEIQFQRAGKGPIQKTYKYDPTKQKNPGAQAPISAKKR